MKLVAKPKKKRKKKYSLSCDYILNISNKPKRMRREREKKKEERKKEEICTVYTVKNWGKGGSSVSAVPRYTVAMQLADL